ncbi:hypothetical protein HPP92_021898 [Vanilla planifolia]|uniref:Uncharacterized protein n=1 Tax=Vanilla planifolia TaxID=51239 RepID=A0A835UF51_VANPL|nr:hypothetical protein HPP92_022226 [Vanilla planifolia]KAG0458770.1 hypothetical protein HPP92_021898 [Vanilla planifolia]
MVNKEPMWGRALRGVKTLFFVANLLASLLLVCAPPLLVILLDVLVPSTLLVFVNGPGFLARSLTSHWKNIRLLASLVDLLLVSIARSLLILCFYLGCHGRGPYVGVTIVCAMASVGYVSAKAIYMFGTGPIWEQRHLSSIGAKEGPAVEVLFTWSLALAMAHMVAAYRTNSRERRKLLVYKIDIEAVEKHLLQKSGGKGSSLTGFQRH